MKVSAQIADVPEPRWFAQESRLNLIWNIFVCIFELVNELLHRGRSFFDRGVVVLKSVFLLLFVAVLSRGSVFVYILLGLPFAFLVALLCHLKLIILEKWVLGRNARISNQVLSDSASMSGFVWCNRLRRKFWDSSIQTSASYKLFYFVLSCDLLRAVSFRLFRAKAGLVFARPFERDGCFGLGANKQGAEDIALHNTVILYPSFSFLAYLAYLC